jgi:hypothetical protein
MPLMAFYFFPFIPFFMVLIHIEPFKTVDKIIISIFDILFYLSITLWSDVASLCHASSLVYAFASGIYSPLNWYIMRCIPLNRELYLSANNILRGAT